MAALAHPVAKEHTLPTNSLPSIEVTLYQGSLRKQGHVIPNWKTRHFVLTQHWLGYYASSGTGFVLKGTLPLGQICGIAPSPKKLLNFQVLTTYNKNYSIIAPSAEERDAWVRMINGARWSIFTDPAAIERNRNEDTDLFMQCLGEIELAGNPDEVVAGLENLLEILESCFHKQTVGPSLRRVAARCVEKKTIDSGGGFATTQRKKLIAKVLRMITEANVRDSVLVADTNWIASAGAGLKRTVSAAEKLMGEHQKKCFTDLYVLGDQLGTGAYSDVHTGLKIESKEQVAVKVIRKKRLPDEEYENLKLEVEIMMGLEHPNIVRLIDYFDEEDAVYIITELCRGGELLDRIIELKHYTEYNASEVVFTVATALNHLHKNGIVHRDLKPENILLENSEAHGQVKVADFGFAKFFTADGLHTACGSPSYVAPEILEKRGYGPAVDMWSLGVILYILLSGRPPFYHESQARLFDIILKGTYKMPEKTWKPISDGAKDLVSKLIVVDPTARLSAAEVLEHPWVQKQNLQSLSGRSLSLTVNRLKDASARNKLKLGINTVVAAVKLKNAILSSHREEVAPEKALGADTGDLKLEED